MTIADSGFMMENGASCFPYTPEPEKQIVEDLMNKSESNLKDGNLYYVVSNRWFASWQRYIGQGSDGYPINRHLPDSQRLDVVPSKTAERPGPIDNSDIVSNENEWDGDDPEILRSLEEGRDYILVSQEVWEKLFEW